MKHFLWLAALLPTVLSAESFGTPAGCALMRGTPMPQTDGPVAWDQDLGVLYFHETTCLITETKQVGSGGILLSTLCTGEGDTWEAWFDMAALAGDRFSLSPQEAPSVSHDLRRCD